MRRAIFLLLLVAGLALAQTTSSGNVVGLDCWVGQDGPPRHTNFIRCMVDRDLPYPVLADQRLDDFLTELHKELHAKSGADAERMYKANIELVRESISIWNIRIFTYPYEWSWQEGRPQQLVRSVLCPRDVSAWSTSIRTDHPRTGDGRSPACNDLRRHVAERGRSNSLTMAVATCSEASG
ncbi:MAG: hypothetical protein HZB40_12510 [Rhodocyclales bacterium]|nr:hypothetical protein [Rhodocyclales bacterium]